MFRNIFQDLVMTRIYFVKIILLFCTTIYAMIEMVREIWPFGSRLGICNIFIYNIICLFELYMQYVEHRNRNMVTMAKVSD